MGINTEKIRKDFPILSREDKPIIYLDNACMSLRPRQVIEAQNNYYENFPACGGRSHHALAKKVTEEIVNARKTVAKFFGAKNPDEIVFTKNTTESLNLMYNGLSLNEGDTVLTTDKEHNSNLIPLHFLKKRKGVNHKVVFSKLDNGFDIDAFQDSMDKTVKLVSMVHTSNLDGCTLPVREIVKITHDFGALFSLDGAQSAPHKEINLKKLDVDFFSCSGHKMLGPSGTGMFYGRYDLLESLEPFIVGGDTVIDSTFENHSMEGPPAKFEAGLQNYAGIMGFAGAARYISSVGRSSIEKHEIQLNQIVSEDLLSFDKIKLIGPKDACYRSGIFSFNIDGIEYHTISHILDESKNIMIRSGAHCVHSWFNHHKMKGSARASFYLYNTKEEAEIFSESVKNLLKLT